MHLAEQCHVFDRVTAGWGGADARLAGDASSRQPNGEMQHFRGSLSRNWTGQRVTQWRE